MAEPEPLFLTSVITSADASAFELKGVAIRTEHDPVQIEWESASRKKDPVNMDQSLVTKAITDFLKERGEPAAYLHVHAAVLAMLAKNNMLKPRELEFDETLRRINNAIAESLRDNPLFVHHSSGENVDTGLWGLEAQMNETLADRVEKEIVGYLQKNPNALYLEIENDLNEKFKGLMAPSKGLIYAVLNSYAERNGGSWKLRVEDVASARREEYNNMFDLLERIGDRLGFNVERKDRIILWTENRVKRFSFILLASALIGPASEFPDAFIVIPGGRAELIAQKQRRDPNLAAMMKDRKILKYRLLRAIAEAPILTRETFEEQIASDPVEKSAGQMILF
jgi:hypothetical protein